MMIMTIVPMTITMAMYDDDDDDDGDDMMVKMNK